MSPDQVEDTGWSADDWSSLNDLAASTVAHHAQLRRVIPEGPEHPNDYLVEMPTAGDTNGALTFDVAKTHAVTRVDVKFTILAEQLHDLVNIRFLVERVAKHLANLEDAVLAHGSEARIPAGGQLRPKEGNPRLFASTPIGADDDVIEAIKIGVKQVQEQGFAGPFHAALGFDAYASLVQDTRSSRATGVHRAKEMLGSADAHIARIPPGSGPSDRDRQVIVFAPDRGSLDLVWTQRPRISHVQTTDGNLTLRLEEAFLLRVKANNAVAVVEQKKKKA